MTKNTITALFFVLFFSSILATALCPLPVSAGPDEMLWGGYMEDVQTTTGLGDRDPREMIASLLRVALGFIGIISVIIILLAGMKWMTSYGDEERVAAAKGMIASGAAGLIIVIFSFGLSQFVLNSLYTATGAIGG
ncbi:hypothetical protein A2303_02700 [Candidatus Falkowbacteria bacterium RIFOXYB2_FULL_47_14]|uniref:DUF4134 domain-containing protein n=1 Tax=Candidatus Falkowbacteria bacterium RIFOXYA2_FULL_47_19 TaxID=1797994 RepID=A0A1F5SH75_9BACT|nr:MAG: hypothetical protein A2227_05730 [Candidatus Falkowbacteria bacterium RIFOXYA2_FULL_47_19]OGF34513.1 MAG: hypothetical protein A2468_04775 [Candidatus Falkowbacteria bacterium RIFOXYC2_FULL_46_15]OGF43032.1 MAG: hypothetical protein A2303_02700 [Candidatus Falkowbacteria bacterium RIFOXYB2_FULL_47_14]